jgi:molybdate transport system substrate-binding protein
VTAKLQLPFFCLDRVNDSECLEDDLNPVAVVLQLCREKSTGSKHCDPGFWNYPFSGRRSQSLLLLVMKAEPQFPFRTSVLLFAIAYVVFMGIQLHAAEITVFAAASLSDALKTIAQDYRSRGEDKIVFNFGASSTLARQIEEGAPADIFFSADEAKMDRLQKKGLIFAQTRKSRLSNALVIVVAADGGAVITSPDDLKADWVKRIALAEPTSVPAGIYAKEFLKQRNLWPAVESKIIPTENVRAALAAVEAGNVDAGIVYKTDAAISKKVKIAFEVPPSNSPNISYPVAVVKAAKQYGAADQFVQFVNSDRAGKIFEKFGFIVRR